MKFDKAADLYGIAARHPGALTANFRFANYLRLSKGVVSNSKQMREVDVAQWMHQFSGLSDTRDVRESLTLAQAMNHINRRQLSQAMDVMRQRLLAVHAARVKKGGSWEKAAAIELVPSGHSIDPANMLALTN